MTSTANGITAGEVRRRVGHPVVDGDGHFLELMPLVNDEIMSHLEDVGGTALADRYAEQVRGPFDTAVFQADRTAPEVLDRWASMPSWWGNPVADAHDRGRKASSIGSASATPEPWRNRRRSKAQGERGGFMSHRIGKRAGLRVYGKETGSWIRPLRGG